MKPFHILSLILAALWSPLFAASSNPVATSSTSSSTYYDHGGRDDVLAGGIKLVLVDTPKGKFKVWTKRVGNNPRIKLLLLHGGPGATHEYFEACDSYLPAEGIEYYYYDQLGSAYSDQPNDESLWETERFVEEVEQVRKALGLDRSNFYLLGQSWGGILAIEYALKYQQHLKGLVISNMMASIPAYNDYAKKVLMPAMNQKALAELLKLEAAKDYSNPRYDELLITHYYSDHILRMPVNEWPDPVLRMLSKLNKKLYTLMQGPSEMGALPGCRLERWDRTADLPRISVPTLVIGARHDTMDPAHMEWMAKQFPSGRYLYCANGSHLSIYDDQKVWFSGLTTFLRDIDRR
jgi:proline iminopeptidase